MTEASSRKEERKKTRSFFCCTRITQSVLLVKPETFCTFFFFFGGWVLCSEAWLGWNCPQDFFLLLVSTRSSSFPHLIISSCPPPFDLFLSTRGYFEAFSVHISFTFPSSSVYLHFRRCSIGTLRASQSFSFRHPFWTALKTNVFVDVHSLTEANRLTHS